MNKYFGTDGIRGTYGSDIMNEDFAQKVGKAIGTFVKIESPDDPTIAIASDTRPSGPSLKNALVHGLQEVATKVIDFGIVPTPALAYGLIGQKANFGVMISASHNHFSDNGIKCFSAKGTKLSLSQELEIENLIEQNPNSSPAPSETSCYSLLDDYLENLLAYFSNLDLTGLSVALDCANGATCDTTGQILKKLGAKVFTLHDGDGMINQQCGSEHLHSLISEVQKRKTDLGIAHDGDGDRVRFVDGNGRIIDGDQVLGLLALHAHQKSNLHSKTFVSTVHSNSGLSSFLNQHGIISKKSDVGDKNVFLKMVETGSNWGGESSGHIICTDYLPTGDGLFAALSVLRILIEKSKTISSLVSEIKLWPSLSATIPVTQKPPLEKIPELQKIISKEKSFLGKEGRILVRYSGTEPKLRLLVEGKSPDKIRLSYQSLKDAIEKHCKGS